jgi:hypothetical protein
MKLKTIKILCVILMILSILMAALAMVLVTPADAAGDCPWRPYRLHIPVVLDYGPYQWDPDNDGQGVEP